MATTSTGVVLDASALEGIVPEIWATMLGRDLVRQEESASAGTLDLEESRTITGFITLVGAFSGAITLRCTSAAATRFAAAMLLVDDATAMPMEEVRDALAELTNMTGGCFKNVIDPVAKLGLPTVMEGFDYHVTLPRTRPVLQFRYSAKDGTPEAAGDVIVVTLHMARFMGDHKIG